MEFNLKHIIQALLFSSSEPLRIKDVQAVITRYHTEAEKAQARSKKDEPQQAEMEEVVSQVPSLVTATQIRDALNEISEQLEASEAVYRLVEGPSGYRITTSPDYADWVRLLRNEPPPQRLSAAALETLAVVAYRQPVTRAEIEAVRGVASDSPVNTLIEHELIHVQGRAELPGRPLQYATTDHFLEFCGLRSLDELPASDVLTPAQLSEWIRQATHPEQPPSDTDVGLPSNEETA